MIYREYLVMRKALAWFAVIVLVIELIDFVPFRSDAANLDVQGLALTAGIFAAFFAWIFGVALGNGSREPARVLWVLPAERWKLALQTIAVDLAGATIAFTFVYTLQLIFDALVSLRFPVHVSGRFTVADIVLGLALVYAMYGWSALVGMIGRRIPYGALLTAPVLVLWFTIAQQQIQLGRILRAPIVANPIAVVNTGWALQEWQQHRYAVDAVSSSLQWLGTTWEAPVMFAIALVTCALATLLWQRTQLSP